jgi:hypothetical protein
MPLTRNLTNFALSEFRHPEIVDSEAADFLQSVRTLYSAPMTLTSDGRTEAENDAAGGSPTSWHLKGRAFDVRAPEGGSGWWKLVAAIFTSLEFWRRTTNASVTVELELCPASSGQPHLHFALKNDGSPSVLLFG